MTLTGKPTHKNAAPNPLPEKDRFSVDAVRRYRRAGGAAIARFVQFGIGKPWLGLACISVLLLAGTSQLSGRGATETDRPGSHDKVNAAEDLSALRREMALTHSSHVALQRQSETLRHEIGILTLRLSALRQHDTETLARETETALKHLQRISQRISDKRARLQENQLAWANTLVILSRLGRRAGRPVYFIQDNGVALVRSQRLMAAVARELGADVVALRRDLIALERTEQQLEEETETLGRLARTFRDEITALEAEQRRRRSDRNAVTQLANARAGRIARLQERIVDLQSMVEAFDKSADMDAMVAERKVTPEMPRDVRQTIESSPKPVQLPPLVPPQVPPLAELPAPNTDILFQPRQSEPAIGEKPPILQRFSQLRGHLPVPVDGQVVQAYGDRDQVGLLSKGITLETMQGSKVTAPHEGKVMFAGPFRNYGQLLIISLGEGYHMLLAGMSRIYPKVGQSIHKGQSLGEMGKLSDHRPTLYVELRRKGEPINPLPWMAASNGKVSG